MCGNGVKTIGTKTITVRQRMEAPGQRTLVLLSRYFGAALGASILGIAVPLIGTGLRTTIVATSSVFGCAV